MDRMSTRIGDVLKNLCCNNGWSYGIFWSVDRQNSMLLTIDDAYFGETFGMDINNMLQQVRVLGEGIVGEAACTGKHQWLFSDTFCHEWGPMGSVTNQNVFQDISEFNRQFSSGIKVNACITIALITLAPHGIMQFGSTEKIRESLDFVNHIRYMFQQLISAEGQLSRHASMPLNHEVYGPSTCANYDISNILKDGSGIEVGSLQSPMFIPQTPPLYLDLQNSTVIPLMSSSVHLQNQFQTPSTTAEFTSPTPNMQSPQVSSQFTSSTDTRNLTWSTEESSWAMLEQQMLSGIRMEEFSNSFPANSHTALSCVNKVQNFQGNTNSSSSYDIKGLPNLVDNTPQSQPVGYRLGKMVDDQVATTLLHATECQLPKGFTAFQMFTSQARPASNTLAPSPNSENNLSQWIAQSVDQANIGVTAHLDDNVSQAHGSASSSGFIGVETLKSNSFDNVNTMQTIDPFRRDVSDDKETMQLPADSDLFDTLGLDFEQGQRLECWDDYTFLVVSGSHSSLSTGASDCISDLDVGSTAGPQKGFLVDPRLEQLLDGVTCNTSDSGPSLQDRLSTLTKATMTATANVAGKVPLHNDQVHLESYSCSGGSKSKDSSLPKYRVDKSSMKNNQKDNELKAHVGSWIDDSYSITNESAASTHTKRSEEKPKVARRKGQPRESTRPRPKDRQQIQDRVKELREIVPSSAKCSIDALLDRTIKHMLFLQSVTKHADIIKLVDEPKIIGNENGVILKDNSSGGGATWAFEVGGQTMVCPIIVEDMNPPGQMLVEMLCEERGYFLEIADTIRGFGLTILKGVMEVREDKIWARFIVEVLIHFKKGHKQDYYKNGNISFLSSASTTNNDKWDQSEES
ncbi:hypothetical protein IFM89_026431, partial [Coptis chinensis]